jgi:hypothetical protein
MMPGWMTVGEIADNWTEGTARPDYLYLEAKAAYEFVLSQIQESK